MPLMAAAPGMPEFQKLIPPGTRRREPVATLDVGATSLELAGITVPDYMDSANLFE